MLATLIGGLLGGIFRCIPEILNFFDKKNERSHELAMQDKAMEFQRIKGDQQIDEIKAQGQADWDKGSLETLKEAIKSQQVSFTPTGIKWVDGLMAFTVFMVTTVRPVITYIVIGLYVTAKIFLIVQAGQHNQNLGEMVKLLWTEDDQGILAGILNFWFLGRVFDKAKQ
jgi:hypothetical protein